MGIFDIIRDVGNLGRGCATDGYGFTDTDSIRNKINEEKRKFNRNSFLDHATNKYVEPEIGSVVLCDLSPIPGLSALNLNAEHTGIYVGNGKIIHRSGDGYIESVTPKQFLERLNGKNCAISVYVSCLGDKSLNIFDSYNRATSALGDPRHQGYDLFKKNCHHFTKYCLTGEIDNHDFTFTTLEIMLKSDFNMDNWRIWNY